MINKKIVSLFLVFTMLASLLGMATPGFAEDEKVISKVIYDFTNSNYKAKYSSNGYYYLAKILADNTEEECSAFTFRNKNNVKTKVVDGQTAICYNHVLPTANVTDVDTYITMYSTSDGNTRQTIDKGRYVFTCRFYSSTDELNGNLRVRGLKNGSNNDISSTLFNESDKKIKAQTWYIFKFVIDLDNDFVIYTLTEESPASSAQAHILSARAAYNNDTFDFLRCDFDITSESTSDFCAYDDFKLTYNTHSSKINAVSNGNANTTTYDKGIFTAETAGSGIFAVALYKGNEITKISVAQNEDELESVKVNMFIDETEGTTMKIFRFDADGTPICVNKSLTPKEKNYEIYFNETFDQTPIAADAQPNGTTKVLSDGKMILKYNNYNKDTRFGTFPIRYPEKNIIIEGDFELPEGKECAPVKLICIYYNKAPVAIAYMNANGIKKSAAGNDVAIVDDEVIEKDRNFNLALKLDLEKLEYDIFYEREKVNSAPIKMPIDSKTAVEGFSVYMPIIPKGGEYEDKNNPGTTLYDDTEIHVDNIRAYSGTDFINIGNERANSHIYSLEDASTQSSNIYERPNADQIAKKVLSSQHPRVILNKNRVNEIKNSNDPQIVSMRNAVIEEADNLLNQEPYAYEYSSTKSIGNISDALNLMMNLGMAYLLTGDAKYPERAYKEAEVLYNVPFKDHKNNTTANRDYWNSFSYLDVAEISAILAICYDWMYDGLTPKQRIELENQTMEKGILRSFRTIYSEDNPTTVNPIKFNDANNWGAVCNGGIFMASIAFMEADAFRCSEMAEANLRGLEYFLKSYAPSGAWSEGVGYWAYSLKYLSYICSTLDSLFGTDFGISKSEGLENSQYFSVASEGKTAGINFGDSGSDKVDAPFIFYWAKKFQNKEMGAVAKYIKNNLGNNYTIQDLIYYDPSYIKEDNYDRPHFFLFGGGEIEQVTMDSDSLSNGTFVAMTGGKGSASNHDHLDSGSVIVDMNGIRILRDAGAEHYGASSYFSTNRYWYYKARPEGHNIFVINPQNLTDGTDSEGNAIYYHGQSKTAISPVTSSSKEAKWATIDLSDAYARDAESASRTIKLNGKDVVIEDEISLKSDGSLVEWYYHFDDIASYVNNNETKYIPKAQVNSANGEPYCQVSIEGNRVYITYQGYTVTNGKFAWDNTFKTFEFNFQAEGADIEIAIKDGARNEYDADVIANYRSRSEFSYDYYGYYNPGNNNSSYKKNGNTFPLDKIVVKMNNVSGNVKLTTTVKAVQQ